MSRPSAYRAINHTGPWTFGGLAIATDNAALWASPAAADPADTAAPQVQTTLANVDDDLVITIDVPAGHIHAVTVTDATVVLRARGRGLLVGQTQSVVFEAHRRLCATRQAAQRAHRVAAETGQPAQPAATE